MTEQHQAIPDPEFTRQFREATLDPKLFTHEAHLRLAWIYLTTTRLNTAVDIITSQLKNYTKAVGAEDKYNETVTIAAVHAVHHFLIRSNTKTFTAFINENSQLKTNFKGLINTHYSTDIFKSDTAKKLFLQPELLPFD